MKKFFSEFKEFVMRGNVLDLAVGVIIGAAFQAIVTSLTSDIISPILGIFGGMNFDQLSFTINGATICYGKFITAIINFLIIRLCQSAKNRRKSRSLLLKNVLIA